MRYTILDYIKTHPGCLQRDVPVAVGIGKTSAEKHIRALVRDGYVQRTRDRGYGNGFQLYFSNKCNVCGKALKFGICKFCRSNPIIARNIETGHELYHSRLKYVNSMTGADPMDGAQDSRDGFV